MLTQEDKQDISEVIATSFAAGLKKNNCLCKLSPDAQGELPHLMGMVKDLGRDSYSSGIEVMRQNNRVLMRFRNRVDRLSQGIAWLIVASGVGGLLWMISEGFKTAIKSIKGG